MNDFPRWKYVLVAAVLLFGIVYALPILFPQQPAVQISANRGATVDLALKEKVLGVLQTRKLDFKDVELDGDRLLVRFANTEVQLAASDVLKSELGDQYVVALNLASTVPGWLRAIGANRMPLGLDLQGGVHFLMEVDQKAALARCSSAMSMTSAPRCATPRSVTNRSTPVRKAWSSCCVRRRTAGRLATSSPRTSTSRRSSAISRRSNSATARRPPTASP